MTGALEPAVQAVDPEGSIGALLQADPGFLALGAAILFLFACALVFALVATGLRYRNRRRQRVWEDRERRWEPVLLEVLNGTEEPEALWQRIEPGEGLPFVDYLLRYARRVRGSARTTLTTLAEPYLPAMVERMTGGDPERRGRAVETVALLGFEAYADRIAAALEDDSPLVTMIAARNIARSQDPRYVPLLLDHLPRLVHWSPRQLSALLSSMGVEAAPALRAALRDPARPASLRAVAADALHQLRDPASVEAAVTVLRGADDRELLAAALRLLGTLGGPEQAPLVRSFCTAADPVVRGAAFRALTTTGVDGDHRMLRDALEDESSWVAIQAARALADTGDEAVLRALVDTDHPRSALARQVLVERL